MNTMVKWCPQVDHITLRIGWSGHDSLCGPELLLQPHITDVWPGFPKLKDITIEKTSEHRAPTTEKSLYDQLAKNSLVTVIAANMTYHRETQGVWYIVEPPRQREKQNKPNRKKPLSQAERVQKKQELEKAEKERKAAEPAGGSKEEADRKVALKKFGEGGSKTRHAIHWIYKKSEGIVVDESETQDVHDKGKEKKEAVDPKDDSPYAPDYTSEPEDERDATTRKPSTAESPFRGDITNQVVDKTEANTNQNSRACTYETCPRNTPALLVWPAFCPRPVLLRRSGVVPLRRPAVASTFRTPFTKVISPKAAAKQRAALMAVWKGKGSDQARMSANWGEGPHMMTAIPGDKSTVSYLRHHVCFLREYFSL